MAQQLDALTIGLIAHKKIVHVESFQVLPEQYLFTIETTLKLWEVKIDDIALIHVVVGPGSFTSCRVVTTIANALAFALSVPVHGMENPDGLPLESLIASTVMSSRAALFVLPSYNRPANITQPRSIVHGDKTME